ncbi:MULTISPECIES: M4 family metallopeptidase [unclassified Brevibacterium]|uniref:M4 family metallopeptidase n=1 Tax=unclassified Brevibacterium TaxID=2614124 RepID=UPI001091CECD|nr:M4 family metallopeptidase [Brevibacterium sp. S22]TGD32025.1 M4 family peptidase [Brevibacterium sp. S22]
MVTQSVVPFHSVVPPYLLDAIAERGSERFPRAAAAAASCRMSDESCRNLRLAGLRYTPPADLGTDESALAAPGPAGLQRLIHDAQNTEVLPGELVRSEGDAEVADEPVNEAYDGLGAAYALFSEVFGRDSLDGQGMPLMASVHYGRDYDNAFFDGRLMVFGDGDDEVFTGFTGSLSIIGHELSHGVISHTADLEYFGQPGALNEHCADVFGTLTQQHDAGQDAEDADWLIGSGIFTPEVTGRALRSMIEPGTAYDDDVLGKDPQPAHMDDFITTDSDNGGVHLNSGIPNRAFALAATSVGGPAWESVGQVWYSVLTGSEITKRTDFAEFAELTIAEAADQFGAGSDVHDAIVSGWEAVGISHAGSARGNQGSSW